jgi:hypothetical protein
MSHLFSKRIFFFAEILELIFPPWNERTDGNGRRIALVKKKCIEHLISPSVKFALLTKSRFFLQLIKSRGLTNVARNAGCTNDLFIV